MPPQGRLGDRAQIPACAHGCSVCPHPAVGPTVQGSENVFVNSLPAVRIGDQGIHTACCGPNKWVATKGSSSVFINGRPAHRQGDMTVHCGGVGKLIQGSPDVTTGG